MIEIKFVGNADEVREEMARMLGLVKRIAPPAAPATIQPMRINRAKTVSGITETMNADTAESLETPVDAPQSAQDAPGTKDGQTVAEAAPEAPAKAESKPEPPAKPTPTEAAIDEANGVMGFTKPDESVPPVAKPAEAPASDITLVQARERMNGLRQKFGAKAVRQVLDTLGFPKFTDVPSEKYAELMVLCDAMEKGMENA